MYQSSLRQTAKRGEEGFTLVELMVVIVILGLLATIVAINVLPATGKANIEKTKADIATIEQALERPERETRQHRANHQEHTVGEEGELLGRQEEGAARGGEIHRGHRVSVKWR